MIIKFKFTNDRPIYSQIVEQLTILVVSGKIPPGEKLPSVRELAETARVNPNTMQRALTELESSGLIFTERTTGKYVSKNLRSINKSRRELARAKIQTFLKSMKSLGFSESDVIEILQTKEVK